MINKSAPAQASTDEFDAWLDIYLWGGDFDAKQEAELNHQGEKTADVKTHEIRSA